MNSVLTVVGCGGDRDKAKRPFMAEVACELSDRVFFTSDNPRSEDPSEYLRIWKLAWECCKTKIYFNC